MERKLFKMKHTCTAFLFCLGLLLGSCSATKEQQVEDELADFRSWVGNTTSNVADRTEEDWQQAKQDFRQRTEELDQKQDQFSDKLKQDYQTLKQEFESADAQFQQRMQTPELGAWEGRLLGEYAAPQSVTETNVREAYITFMENVRAQNDTWTDQDWEMAKMVLERLNERKQQLTGDIPTDTEVKIKALQMEFRTLETAADVTDGN